MKYFKRFKKVIVMLVFLAMSVVADRLKSISVDEASILFAISLCSLSLACVFGFLVIIEECQKLNLLKGIGNSDEDKDED